MGRTKQVWFVTPTQLSILDLITLGSSEKKGDETKIGEFCTGLKYALAILKRNNVVFQAQVTGSKNNLGEYCTTTFRTGHTLVEDDYTGKSYEVLTIVKNIISDEDTSGEVITTGISTSFGEKWSLWQAFREIYSNMLDEGGYCTEELPIISPSELKTVIQLNFDEDSEFDSVWKKQDEYFLQYPELDYTIDKRLSIGNNEGHLKVYKQGILVYEDLKIKSPFKYNISYGELDERRVLHNPYNIRSTILEAFNKTSNLEFIETLLTGDYPCEWLVGSYHSWGTNSDIIKLVNRLDLEGRLGRSLPAFLANLKEQDGCLISGRSIKVDAWRGRSYSTEVKVEETIKNIEEKKGPDLPEQITLLLNKYKVELKYPVIIGSISGATSVYDSYTSTIIISEDFSADNELDVKRFILNTLMIGEKESQIDVVLSKYLSLIVK